MTAGIVNVVKPPGMTSHDVVSFIRRTYGLKKVGHAGTLDPAAAGVLPVFLGKATRLIEYAMQEDKSYRVELTLGYETDTGDDTGKTLSRAPFVMPAREKIEGALASFVGTTEQVPPMYSAIKVDGQKLYELARAGVDVEVKPRHITIYEIKLLKVSAEGFLFDVVCSKGTYIRSLCIDIGKKLGILAVMSFLVRTRAGQFALAEAHTLEEIAAQKEDLLLPLDSVLGQMPSLTLTDDQANRFCCGQNISCQASAGMYRVYNSKQELIGIGEVAAPLLLTPIKVLM
ncbi:MAG: tRNA pseudouridine(55) synthase TruB [Pelosinus sp.]|nr:tRNA pseudouridine(55) synthase TruB [Pelosinus sp.]